MIKFACPKCNKAFQVKDDLAGRKSKCPVCGSPIVVPHPIEAVPLDEVTAKPPYVPQPAPLEAVDVKDECLQHAESRREPGECAYIGKANFWGRLWESHVEEARSRFLGDNERLLAMVKGRAKAQATRTDGFFKLFEFETDKGSSLANHYLIVTDRRVIIWARGLFKSSTDSIVYSDITAVEQQSGMVWGGLVLSVHGNKANFTEMHKEESVLVADIIRQQKQRTGASEQPSRENDPAGQLEKLGGLLEKGLISRDEFEEKKRKLLAQI